MESFTGHIENLEVGEDGSVRLGNVMCEIVHNIKVYSIGQSKVFIQCNEWGRLYNTQTGGEIGSSPVLRYDSIFYEEKGECLIVMGLPGDNVKYGLTALKFVENEKRYVVMASSGGISFARHSSSPTMRANRKSTKMYNLWW